MPKLPNRNFASGEEILLLEIIEKNSCTSGGYCSLHKNEMKRHLDEIIGKKKCQASLLMRLRKLRELGLIKIYKIRKIGRDIIVPHTKFTLAAACIKDLIEDGHDVFEVLGSGEKGRGAIYRRIR